VDPVARCRLCVKGVRAWSESHFDACSGRLRCDSRLNKDGIAGSGACGNALDPAWLVERPDDVLRQRATSGHAERIYIGLVEAIEFAGVGTQNSSRRRID